MTEVRLHSLHKVYHNQHPALTDLSLTIPRGQITALLGPSGCGKTTALKLIAGLLPPTQGDVMFNGRSVLSVPAEKRGAVMVFQNHLLFPHMNVADNVAFGLKMRGVDKRTARARAEEMLERVRLPGYGGRRPQQLSGGQQQRVALARAMVVQPQVLLLDEPLSNLDAHLRHEMRELILSLQRQLAITTIMVTHDQEEAVILADRIALIFDGVLQQVGAPADFYERPSTPAVARFFGGVNFIPGEKQGTQVQTSLGCFQIQGNGEVPDGPVTLSIRPENVRFCNGSRDVNSVPGVVASCVYVGTHTRLRVATEDAALPPLTVIADAASQHDFGEGTAVRLHFPPHKIWAMVGAMSNE